MYPFGRAGTPSVKIATLATNPHLAKYNDNASSVAAKCT